MLRRNYIIHTPEEIEKIRVAARLTAMARDQIADSVQEGMSTKELDMIAGAIIRSTGGKPAFLGYCGYPANICISVNDVVVHGIASDKEIIKRGDVVSVDVGVSYGGAVGDTAKTVYVGGEPEEDVKRLLDGTKLALEAGIKAAVNGHCIHDLSAAVERVGVEHHLGIVREYVGHGCGIRLHEPPDVPNFTSHGSGVKLLPGMVLCIEPMFNLGTHKIYVESDEWTVRTADGKKSAHFEHMVLIGEDRTEVLTSV